MRQSSDIQIQTGAGAGAGGGVEGGKIDMKLGGKNKHKSLIHD